MIDVSKLIISKDSLLCYYAFEPILTDLCINFSLINIKRRKREPRLPLRMPRKPRKRRKKKRPSKLKRMVVCQLQAEQQAMELMPEELKLSTSTKRTSVDRKIVMKLVLQEVIALRT